MSYNNLFKANMMEVNKVKGILPFMYLWQLLGFDKNTTYKGNSVVTSSFQFGFFFK